MSREQTGSRLSRKGFQGRTSSCVPGVSEPVRVRRDYGVPVVRKGDAGKRFFTFLGGCRGLGELIFPVLGGFFGRLDERLEAGNHFGGLLDRFFGPLDAALGRFKRSLGGGLFVDCFFGGGGKLLGFFVRFFKRFGSLLGGFFGGRFVRLQQLAERLDFGQ